MAISTSTYLGWTKRVPASQDPNRSPRQSARPFHSTSSTIAIPATLRVTGARVIVVPALWRVFVTATPVISSFR
jgi:hypothetical protein